MKKQNKRNQILGFLAFFAALWLLNLASNRVLARLDLTEEKRYSLAESTRELLKSLDERVLVTVYLEGDFPSGFRKLQRETRQMLNEFRAYSPYLEYRFIDPSNQPDEKSRNELYQQLRSKGLISYQIDVNEKGGSRSIQVFPGAIVALGEQEISVQILQGLMGQSAESQMNASVEKLEYNLANAIKRITTKTRPTIAFLEGHGQLKPNYLADLGRTLSEYYRVERFNLRQFDTQDSSENISISAQMRRLNSYNALLIAKPTQGFADLDRYLIDQYIMQGGKVVWLVDMVLAEMDSLSRRSEFLAIPLDEKLNLRDMLYKYGVRVNTDLVQDIMATGLNDSRSIKPWIYAPMVMPYIEHPITKDLNGIRLDFASSIDTILAPGIKKTILLQTSPYSRTAGTPHVVSLARLYEKHNPANFQKGPITLGVLMEGSFTSAFANRVKPRSTNGEELPMVEKGKTTQMVVIGDGDLARNQLNIVNPNLPKGLPLTTGYDQFTDTHYGNKDFMLNVFDFLLDKSGMMALRSRELKIRLLDMQRIQTERQFWVGLNTVLPLVSILLLSSLTALMRRHKYAKNP